MAEQTDTLTADVDAASSCIGALAKRLFPEWGGRVYVVPASRLPDDLREQAAAWQGWTSPVLDLLVRPAIPEWRGRGPALVWQDAVPFADYFAMRKFALEVAVHEFAHMASWRSGPVYVAPAGVSDEALAAASREGLEQVVAAQTAAEVDDATFDRWRATGHDWRFARVATAACVRAISAGYRVDPGEVFRGCGYRVNFDRYQRALQGDAGVALTELGRTAPPVEFLGLWLADVGLRPTAAAVDALIDSALTP